jgi:hypothetical protein
MNFKGLPIVCEMVDEPIRWTLNCGIEGTLELMIDQVVISEVHILINVVRELDTSNLKKLDVTERVLNEL